MLESLFPHWMREHTSIDSLSGFCGMNNSVPAAEAARPELGVCYYPEHWPESIWKDDAQRMRKLGISWVRIGEFAWSLLEPRPGDYNFAWLDRAIAILKETGLKVVLGTPTAAPPLWMADEVEDLHFVDAQGRALGFGSRRHYTVASRGYRQQCARIAEQLARRYGEQVDAWQIDNEYGCNDTAISYGPADVAAFREWLRQRYGDIESLNQAWGNVFWSMQYSSFDQLEAPIAMPAEPNPAHLLAWRRCASEQVSAFNRIQADAIRRHSQAPITHNFMDAFFDFDHHALGRDLDFASWDSYPLAHLLRNPLADDQHRLAFARQGDIDYQSFYHDLYRGIGGGRAWVMEQQPGPVNWAAYNPAPLPGIIRMWAWVAFAHGIEVVSYFRWRQCPFAQEQMHSGLLLPDSSDGPACAEVAQVAGEIGDMETLPDRPAAPVALVVDYDSHAYWAIQPQGADFRYVDLVRFLYSCLRSLGVEVDMVPADGSGLQERKLVLVPAVAAPSSQLVEALQSSSALVLAGPRTGYKTDEFAIPENLPPGPLADACKLRITACESLQPQLTEKVVGGGSIGKWIEHAEPANGCERLLETEGGRTVLSRCGRFLYLAGWPDEQAAGRVCSLAAAAAGIETIRLPPGLRFTDRGSYRFIFNFSAAARPIGHLCHDCQDELAGVSMAIHKLR